MRDPIEFLTKNSVIHTSLEAYSLDTAGMEDVKYDGYNSKANRMQVDYDLYLYNFNIYQPTKMLVYSDANANAKTIIDKC